MKQTELSNNNQQTNETTELDHTQKVTDSTVDNAALEVSNEEESAPCCGCCGG